MHKIPLIPIAFLVVFSSAAALPVLAQPVGESTDTRLLRGVYGIESPAFGTYMHAVDASAYPVFFGGLPAAWAGVGIIRGGGDWSDAYELTASWATATVASMGLKRLFHRPRPYVALSGITARVGGHAPGERVADPNSFPSGHTTLAFVMATSWSLSHPRWYVIAPAFTWAASVAASRIWLGMHYPTDVLGGAILGILVAVVVHEVGRSITPGFLKKNDRFSDQRGFQFRLRL